jgi:hypothetical protein
MVQFGPVRPTPLLCQSSLVHDHLYQLALGFAFLRAYGLHIHIGRNLEAGVTQEFLDNFRVDAQRLDQSRERVTEGVPGNLLL